MPELPEVETMRRGVLCLEGRRIESVERAACKLRPIQIAPNLPAMRRLTLGQRIEAVQRHGKRILLRLGNGGAVVIEPRMTGLVLLSDPPDLEHLRFRIALNPRRGAPNEAWYWDRRGLGSVRFLTALQITQQLGPSRLGPDALTISVAELVTRLSSSRRPIKPALLDQKALAGVGNIYASELLHAARIDPRAPCRRLKPSQWRRIHQAMRNILEAAIACEGSTLADGTYRNALNQNGSYQNHHRVYDREGQECTTCERASIQRIVQSQRATFFCPRCQGEV